MSSCSHFIPQALLWFCFSSLKQPCSCSYGVYSTCSGIFYWSLDSSRGGESIYRTKCKQMGYWLWETVNNLSRLTKHPLWTKCLLCPTSVAASYYQECSPNILFKCKSELNDLKWKKANMLCRDLVQWKTVRWGPVFNSQYIVEERNKEKERESANTAGAEEVQGPEYWCTPTTQHYRSQWYRTA